MDVGPPSNQGIDADLALDDDHLNVTPSGPGTGAGWLLAFDRDGCGQASCSPAWAVPVGGQGRAPTVAGDLTGSGGGQSRSWWQTASSMKPWGSSQNVA